MVDIVIYDGNCNLCVTLVQALEQLDRGQRFVYVPMQYPQLEAEFGASERDCQMGMLVIDGEHRDRRWQGSDAAEELARRFPASAPLVAAYRALPGMKWMGDRAYEQIRDNRYAWFGRRSATYRSPYPACESGSCQPFPETAPAEPASEG
ncbi:thiol-disulfide oxidoreductase DCC family protein [Synechococcus sp. PCC 7336]|uniref:thiol-disulfide oxidoreductase DCC family protein n=1 Tax=Synechococcus sp. PCC 7336 TaxID=195250 RepID=UPI000346E43B|nr:DCC1-like thiol-disulfide oxidoreductase family protein [Synechococcus sp. PCC 7336]